MKCLSVGQRLFLSVLSVFLIFSVCFIVFQQYRERLYKVSMLEQRLMDYNDRMNEFLHLPGNKESLSDKKIDRYVRQHSMKDLRVTLIRPDGRVFYDNINKDYAHIANHSNRQEVVDALAKGRGSTVERKSQTFNSDYFYTASYFPRNHIIIRTALPYDEDLSETLRADQHFVWFAIIAIIILSIGLYRFVHRLGINITKLKVFASRADHGESLETEELAAFPNDELGEIAERIIKLYKRLQSTRKEQDELKRELTQNVAHELKTPVASIQGYLETILSNPSINETTKEMFLRRCHAQSERLTALLHDISTLNRLDDGASMIDFDTVDIVQLIEDVKKVTALQLANRRMTFDVSLPSSLTVRGNRSLLYSIFRNLTDNSIAYAGEGTTITLSAKEEQTKWRFSFADNGVGVPPEHLPRLFERFYRVDKGRSRKMGGTGLGLAIVKNAVLVHDGVIRATCPPEGGLQFVFTIKK